MSNLYETTDPAAEVPEFTHDIEKATVRVGDRIAYAVRDGDRAALRVGTVLGFQWAKSSTWSFDRNTGATYQAYPLKIRVDVELGERDVLIEAGLKRFVVVEKASTDAA